MNNETTEERTAERKNVKIKAEQTLYIYIYITKAQRKGESDICHQSVAQIDQFW